GKGRGQELERERFDPRTGVDADLRALDQAPVEHQLAQAADPVAAHLGLAAVRVAVIHEKVGLGGRRDAAHTAAADPEPPVAQASRQLLAELETPRDVLEQDEIVARPVVLPETKLIHPRSPGPPTGTPRCPRGAARPRPPPPRTSGSSGPAGRRRAAGARAPSSASPCPQSPRRAGAPRGGGGAPHAP